MRLSLGIWCFECSNCRAYWNYKAQSVIWIYSWANTLLLRFFVPLTDNSSSQGTRLLKLLRKCSCDHPSEAGKGHMSQGGWKYHSWNLTTGLQEVKRGVSHVAAEGAPTELWFWNTITGQYRCSKYMCWVVELQLHVYSLSSLRTTVLFRRD